MPKNLDCFHAEPLLTFGQQSWKRSRRLDRTLINKSNANGNVVIKRSDRVHYALGLLSVESDFENLDLDNDENP
jgi:hypothetical protein